MDFQKFKDQQYIKVFVSVLAVVLLISVKSYGQGCPTFQIKEVRESNSSPTGGSVVIGINSNKLYSEANFQLRQKEKDVTGPVGYEAYFQISRNEIVIGGLKKSDELYLKEYVVLFSDEGCDNSQIKEVGTFKIN
jgi:hypothetical protein